MELKNGETYNGHLVNCDTWMNIHLREVICTSKVISSLYFEFLGLASLNFPCEIDVSFTFLSYSVVMFLFCIDWSSGLFSQDGDRFWRMPECYIRGNTIKYLRVPDEVNSFSLNFVFDL